MEVDLTSIVNFPKDFPAVITGVFDDEQGLLITGHDNGFVVKWNLETNEPEVIYEDIKDVRSISLYENNIAVGYRTNGLYIINLDDTSDVNVLQERMNSVYKRIWRTVWPIEDILVTTSTYGKIRKYDFISKTEWTVETLEGHENSIFAADSLNGKYLVTGDWDGKILIWLLDDESDYVLIQKLGITDTVQDIHWMSEECFTIIDESGKVYLFEKESTDVDIWHNVVEVDVANSKGQCIHLLSDRKTILAGTYNQLIQFDIESQQYETLGVFNCKKIFSNRDKIYVLLDSGLHSFDIEPIRIKKEVINYKYVKISLLGHTGTGKSTFCKWILTGDITNVLSTYGKTVYSWVLPRDVYEKRIIFHDHGGQETVIETFLPFIKDSDIILLFYKQKDNTTFSRVINMLNEIKDDLSRNVMVYLIRTHIDDPLNDVTDMEIKQVLDTTIIDSDIRISPIKNIGYDDFYSSVIEPIDWDNSRTLIKSPLNEGIATTIEQLKSDGVASSKFSKFKVLYQKLVGETISEGHLSFLLRDYTNKGEIEFYPKISDIIILYDESYNRLKTEVPKYVGYMAGIVDIESIYAIFGENEYVNILDEMYLKSNLAIKFGTKRIFPYKLTSSQLEINTKYMEMFEDESPVTKHFSYKKINVKNLLHLLSEIRLQCINITKNEGLFEWESNANIYYVFTEGGKGVFGRYVCCVYFISGKDDSIKLRLKKRFDEILNILLGDEIYIEEESKKKGEKTYEFDVALSFAGEQRGYVEQVAIFLEQKGIMVFYDEFKNSKLWGKKLSEYFFNVFRNLSKYCIMFISTEYMKKFWPSLERDSAVERAIEENKEYILPVFFDEVDFPFLKDVGRINGAKRTPTYVVEQFIEKWEEDV